MTVTAGGRTKLRYRWSHRHPAHRAVVRLANRMLPHVPFAVKYGLVDAVRRRRAPYTLLRPDSVAIQVGAPRDTLRAGRSRAMSFARMTARAGRVVVIEPDPVSATEFQSTADRHRFAHVDVVNVAAWSEPSTLTMEIDPAHPASNFTLGSVDYSDDEIARFQPVEVPARRLDDIVAELGVGRIDVVSVTTNGAEREILRGAQGILDRDHPLVCLARTEDSYAALMSGLGYELLSDDDRGFTFRHRS